MFSCDKLLSVFSWNFVNGCIIIWYLASFLVNIQEIHHTHDRDSWWTSDLYKCSSFRTMIQICFSLASYKFHPQFPPSTLKSCIPTSRYSSGHEKWREALSKERSDLDIISIKKLLYVKQQLCWAQRTEVVYAKHIEDNYSTYLKNQGEQRKEDKLVKT